MSRVGHLQHYVSKFLPYTNEKKKSQHFAFRGSLWTFFVMTTLGLSAAIGKTKVQRSDLLKTFYVDLKL